MGKSLIITKKQRNQETKNNEERRYMIGMAKVSSKSKIISISAKRQITIPQQFFEMLGFGDHAECVLKEHELIIRPAKVVSHGEFAEEILEDLIKKGLSGEELLEAFREQQKKVRPAVEAMIQQADRAAEGKGEFYTLADVFEESEE